MRRLRIVVGLFAGLGLLFMLLGNVAYAEGSESLARNLRLAHLVIVCVCLGLLYTQRAAESAVFVALVVGATTLLGVAIICFLYGEVLNVAILAALLTVGASGFLPWSWKCQVALAAMALAAIAGHQLALDVTLQPSEGFAIATACVAIIVSIPQARTHEHARVKGTVDELLRHRAELRLRDVNEKLEHTVEERTARLREVLEEQRAFNYSVSHDLRSPLRHIFGMSAMIEEEYAGRLTETASFHFARVKEASRRMGNLIDALLARSRLGQAELRPRDVDLAELGDRIVAGLRADQPERDVKWSRPDSLAAVGDPTLLSVVLQQLLGNAWKFTRDREQAAIELGVTADGEFFVRDNGIGFAMEDAGKLFESFQRLHGEEYEGTGMGLATVKRIVERHGGAVRISSEPGRGTAVYFRLGEPGLPVAE